MSFCLISSVFGLWVCSSLLWTENDVNIDRVGPMVGAVDATSACLLVRFSATAGEVTFELTDNAGHVVHRHGVATVAANDFVAEHCFEGLEPDTNYGYRLTHRVEGRVVETLSNSNQRFSTMSTRRLGHSKTICFVSCVDTEENPLWKDIERIDPDMICLLGDTPYIDSIHLETVRLKHRQFLQIPVFSDLLARIPTVGTWDDHDFGANNGNGRTLEIGKKITRQGFVEYRAHRQFGTGDEGVYHRIDLGMIDLFLLDPRYFSQTTPSVVNESLPTCFGRQQWDWLRTELKGSMAPYKVLAMGAIWQDKKNSETDDMFTYLYERDALLDFIRSEGISGVLLIGGDIHVARHLLHRDRVGYDLHDFVISPGHKKVIDALDVFHPDLEWSLKEGRQYLTLTADGTSGTPRLIARFGQAGSRVNRTVEIPLETVQPRIETGLAVGLRGYCSFNEGLDAVWWAGTRRQAVSRNGTESRQVAGNGVAAFNREKQQYLLLPKNPLDDNSREHTVAMWMKPATLPRHGTNERAFLFESTAEDRESPRSAWHLSLGLRPANDPGFVNLQLFTHTVAPAEKWGSSPQQVSQGGFDSFVPRSKFDDWVHVAIVYDSETMTVYLDGQPFRQHRLSPRGPASEFGGLVVGGHREGVGRNFDGLIDELAVWARCLSPQELRALAKNRNALEGVNLD